jgi:predicted aldo/keto reductase-like oxidoreductase
MQYREFGQTGLKVSALGFGAMRLPMDRGGQHVDEQDAIRVMVRALELGVNYLDTAPAYCRRESERVVGQAVKAWTKAGNPRPIVSTKNPVDDKTAKRWRYWLESSLKQLDVDYIDVYHMWSISWSEYRDKIDVRGGPLPEARKAKEEGLIRHVAFSLHDSAENLFKVIDTDNFESMTVQYNLLNREHEKAISHAHQKGLGVAIMGPVAGGRLITPSPDIEKMQPVKAMSTPELALRFVLSHPGVSIALSGMNTVQQVEENCATASTTSQLTLEERERVQLALDEVKGLAELYCTGCGYCLPCPHGVNIPANFEYLNYLRVYGLKEKAKDLYAQLGEEGSSGTGLKAEDCQHCGQCERKCPQRIPIQYWLEEAAWELSK